MNPNSRAGYFRIGNKNNFRKNENWIPSEHPVFHARQPVVQGTQKTGTMAVMPDASHDKKNRMKPNRLSVQPCGRKNPALFRKEKARATLK
jgi:hypothetical protein